MVLLNSDLHFEIAIIGAGGIGSNLIANLVPALHRGEMLDASDSITIRVYDSDKVSDSNLAHQRFSPDQVGIPKVEAIATNMLPFIGDKLSLETCTWDVREGDDVVPYDIAIVATDSPLARRVVHSIDGFWLDLRCRGDGYVAMDFRVVPEHVRMMTPDQPAMSCQLDGAISSGNIQFGHTLAAAHGSQWTIQMLRIMSGNNGVLPEPQIASLSFGTLSKHPMIDGDRQISVGKVEPFRHSPKTVRCRISTGDVNSQEVIETVAQLAQEGDWSSLWQIADSMKREISILFDSKGNTFVDVGTRGEVIMSPPIGAEIPFRMWVHTHPLDAYWSDTDLHTLSCFSDILDEAIVLGHDHLKRASRIKLGDSRKAISENGPLSSWTDEETTQYPSIEVEQ